MKKLFPLILLILTSHVLLAQEKMMKVFPKYPSLFKSPPVEIKENSPKWIQLMYGKAPNINQIENAYNEFYKKNKFVKTLHTQNYKHFSGYVYLNEYVKNNGNIVVPSLQEQDEKLSKLIEYQKKTYKNKSIQRKTSANWTPIGPIETYSNQGTQKRSTQVNVYTIDQSLTNPNVLLAGTETGTTYISTDNAENWTVTGDELGANSRSVRAVAIDPTDENIMYIASHWYLYKSINKGTSWTRIHELTNLNITDISINPDNNNEILTAGNKGLFRSLDGGTTWSHLYTEKCWDIERKTDDNSTVFVAKLNATNNVIEVIKTTNITATTPIFVAKTTGWFTPTNTTAIQAAGARIAVTDADPNRLFVLYLGSDIAKTTDLNFLGVYKSDDAGESWSLPYKGTDGVTNNSPGGPYNADNWCFSCFGNGNSLTGGGTYNQGFYNAAIAISDTNKDMLIIGMLSMFRSTDGGETYTPWGGYNCDNCGQGVRHPDIQEIEINGSEMWIATDGGLDKYNATTFNQIGSKIKGMNGAEYWGFGQGWQEDILVGGRYHNGNAVYRGEYTNGKFIYIGGGESPTGYVNQFENERTSYNDISDKVISNNFTGTTKNASINAAKYPNQEIYSIHKRSEVVHDPRFGGTNYLGNENKLWKTTDNGRTYKEVKAFGSNIADKVTDIEIPRNNPDYIYLIQYINSGSSKLWKSIDAGINWTEITLPSSNSNMNLQVATDDENEIYLSFAHDWSNGNKVFKSTNGGSTWTNLTTSTLNRSVRHLVIQDGTDGGVYALTHNDLYYKNNALTDWIPYGNGLPTKKVFNKMIPFYRDNKMRAATYNRGILETPLYEQSKPIAQPSVKNNKIFCARDTVYFKDFSVMKYQGANWKWSFPGANYVSSTTVKNPKVLYSKPGNYDVTLTVTDANGDTSTKSVSNIINFPENTCDIPVFSSQNALYTYSTNQWNNEYLVGKDFNLDNVDHVTITAWIKPDDVTQNGACAIFSAKDNVKNASLALNLRNTNELQIHYNGGQWQWHPGLIVDKDKWNYVALVATPNTITLYLNEEKASRTNTNGSKFNMDSYYVGSHIGINNRVFRGLIDEVKIYNKALTEKEVKLQRHLIPSDLSDPNLQAYWQFNNLIDGDKIYDKKGKRDLTTFRSPEIRPSSAPIGPGVSEKLSITSSGISNFPNTGLKINFGNTNPNGDVYVTKINQTPNNKPAENTIENNYWIVNNYGTNTTIDPINSIEFADFDANGITSNDINLYDRTSNGSEISEWNTTTNGSNTTNNTNKTLTYNNTNITALGQLHLATNITYTWTGATDSDWSKGSNWSTGSVPKTTDNVFIGNTGTSPMINVPITTKSLTINSGATQNIGTNGKLTIEGNLTVNGTLSINSNATENGVLVVKGASYGEITYNKHVAYAAPQLEGWHLISPPVLGETEDDIITNSNLLTNNDGKLSFASYNPNYTGTTGWDYLSADNNGTLISGKGYSAKSTTSSIPFTGTYRKNDFITEISSGTASKWHLIGNPYTTYIAANSNATNNNTNFLTRNINSINDSFVGVYKWNSTAKSYDVINLSSPAFYIAPGMGFFVKSKSMNNPINISGFMKSIQSTNTTGTTNNETLPEITLKIDNQITSKNTIIKYTTTSTKGLDIGYDAGLFDGENGSFKIYSRLIESSNNTNFQLQCLPKNDYENLIVPIGIKSSAGNEITFTAKSSNLPTNINVYLEDREANTFTKLNVDNSDYKITPTVDLNGVGKFFLHTSKKSLTIENLDTSDIKIYKSNNATITIKGLAEENVNFKLFNILGKEMYTTKFVSNGLHEITIPKLVLGVYIIQLKTSSKIFNRKIILE